MSLRAWTAFAALGIIWGIPYFLIKLTVAEVSPFVVAGGRIMLAAVILVPIAWRRGVLGGAGKQRGALCAFAIVEFVIPLCAISLGEQWISSSEAGILIATVPMWVVLLSRPLGVREHLSLRRVSGLVLGFAGVVALLGFGTPSDALGWAGVGCMLIAAIGYALGPLIIQRHLSNLDSLGALAGCLLIASVLMLAPVLLTLPAHRPSAAALASIAVLGVLCTAVAMLLMFYLVNHAGASRATLITYINPAVASLLGISLLHERLGIGGATALGLILLGSWLATHRPTNP